MVAGMEGEEGPRLDLMKEKAATPHTKHE
jgi:hypothetical protein